MSSPSARRGLPISMSTLMPMGYGFQLPVSAQTATPNDLCCVDFVFSLLSLHVYFCVGRHIGFRSKELCKTLHSAGQTPALSRLSNILTNINPSRWMPIAPRAYFAQGPSLPRVLRIFCICSSLQNLDTELGSRFSNPLPLPTGVFCSTFSPPIFFGAYNLP